MNSRLVLLTVLLAIPLVGPAARGQPAVSADAVPSSELDALQQKYGQVLRSSGREIERALEASSSTDHEFFLDLFRRVPDWASACSEPMNEFPGYVVMIEALAGAQDCGRPLHPVWVRGVLLLRKRAHEDWPEPRPTSKEVVQHDFRSACDAQVSVYHPGSVLERLEKTGSPNPDRYLGDRSYFPDGPCLAQAHLSETSCDVILGLGSRGRKTLMGILAIEATQKGCPGATQLWKHSLEHPGGFDKATWILDLLVTESPDLRSFPDIPVLMARSCAPAYFMRNRDRYGEVLIQYRSPEVVAEIERCVLEESASLEDARERKRRYGTRVSEPDDTRLKTFYEPLLQRLKGP